MERLIGRRKRETNSSQHALSSDSAQARTNSWADRDEWCKLQLPNAPNLTRNCGNLAELPRLSIYPGATLVRAVGTVQKGFSICLSFPFLNRLVLGGLNFSTRITDRGLVAAASLRRMPLRTLMHCGREWHAKFNRETESAEVV